MSEQNNAVTSETVMHERNLERVKKMQKYMKIASTVLIYVFLIVVAIAVLFPFYWMLISSVKSLDEYRLSIPTLFPREIILRNYVDAFNTANLGRLFLNTMYVGIVSTIASLVITVLSAFAFARLEFKGRDTLFGILGVHARMIVFHPCERTAAEDHPFSDQVIITHISQIARLFYHF